MCCHLGAAQPPAPQPAPPHWTILLVFRKFLLSTGLPRMQFIPLALLSPPRPTPVCPGLHIPRASVLKASPCSVVPGAPTWRGLTELWTPSTFLCTTHPVTRDDEEQMTRSPSQH